MKLSKALLVAMVLAYWMTPCPAASPAFKFMISKPGIERNSFNTKVAMLEVKHAGDLADINYHLALNDAVLVEISQDADADVKAMVPNNSCNSTLACEQAIEEMCRWTGHSGRKTTTAITLQVNSGCSGSCSDGHFMAIVCVTGKAG